MDALLNVVENADGTHTISWNFTKDEGEKLHSMTVGIGIGTWVDPVTGYTESDNRGIYSWIHNNPYNGFPQYSGSITFDPKAWFPDWTTVIYNAYICQFNTPTSPADQYNCKNALPVTITRVATTAKMNAKKKK